MLYISFRCHTSIYHFFLFSLLNPSFCNIPLIYIRGSNFLFTSYNNQSFAASLPTYRILSHLSFFCNIFLFSKFILYAYPCLLHLLSIHFIFHIYFPYLSIFTICFKPTIPTSDKYRSWHSYPPSA